MKLTVVTCFGPGGWDKYARRFVETFRQHWPAEVRLALYHHDQTDTSQFPEGAVALEEVGNWKLWRERFGDMKVETQHPQSWRWNIHRFGNKVFAIADALERFGDESAVLWLDADIETTSEIWMEWLESFVGGDALRCFKRKNVYIETSAMFFPAGRDRLEHALAFDVEELFLSGRFQQFQEWHDGFIYDAVLHLLEMHGLNCESWVNRADGQGSDAFNTSVLGNKMKHAKGLAKESFAELGQRFIEKHFPDRVDDFVFTECSTAAEALHIARGLRGQKAGVCYTAFNANADDLHKNFFEKVTDDEWRRLILEFPGKGKLAFLLDNDLPPPGGPKEVKVVPRDSVPPEVTFANIDANRALVKREIKPCKPHGERAIIVSGGPSIAEHMHEFQEAQANGIKLVAVKHSYYQLLNAGVVPWACVVLDPRPYDGISTHGIKRDTLFTRISQQTLFFVASMTVPELTKDLLAKGARVALCHMWSEAASKYKWPEGTSLIAGGTCAAMRSIGLLHSLGFREVDLYGFDCCYRDVTPEQRAQKDEQGRPKFLEVHTKGLPGVKWVTTGELMALGQDIEALRRQSDLDMTIRMHGTGLGQQLWKEAGGDLTRPHYADMLLALGV